MRIEVGCQFSYRAAVATHAVIQVEPRLEAGVLVLDEHWVTEPAIGMSRYVDGYGNVCRRGTLPAGDSVLRYDAVLTVPDDRDPQGWEAPEVAPAELPDDVLVFTLPSLYCPSHQMGDVAWGLFGAVPPGWGRVQAICDWVHDHITFAYANASSFATALDVLAAKTGVCRDYAHLAVTLCRALNIPARYVFGYLPDIDIIVEDPMDFCAWIEVYLGDRWWTFDPRNNSPRAGRALIGRGRDALDVAMVSTYGGPQLLDMAVRAELVST